MCARASERASKRTGSQCALLFLVCYLFLGSILVSIFRTCETNMPFYLLRMVLFIYAYTLFWIVHYGAIGFHFNRISSSFLAIFPSVCVCVRRVFATGIRPGKMIFEYIFSAHTSLKEMCVHKVYTLWQFSMVTLIEFNIPHFKSWLNILSQTLPTPIKLKSVRFQRWNFQRVHNRAHF